MIDYEGGAVNVSKTMTVGSTFKVEFDYKFNVISMLSVKLGTPPWSWSSDEWTGFLTFSKEKAKVAEERISDATKDLIDKA